MNVPFIKRDGQMAQTAKIERAKTSPATPAMLQWERRSTPGIGVSRIFLLHFLQKEFDYRTQDEIKFSSRRLPHRITVLSTGRSAPSGVRGKTTTGDANQQRGKQ